MPTDRDIQVVSLGDRVKDDGEIDIYYIVHRNLKVRDYVLKLTAAAAIMPVTTD